MHSRHHSTEVSILRLLNLKIGGQAADVEFRNSNQLISSQLAKNIPGCGLQQLVLGVESELLHSLHRQTTAVDEKQS